MFSLMGQIKKQNDTIKYDYLPSSISPEVVTHTLNSSDQ